MDIMHEKRAALKQHTTFPHQCLITCLLSLQNENNLMSLSDKEIIDNVVRVMTAGHYISSVLITSSV